MRKSLSILIGIIAFIAFFFMSKCIFSNFSTSNVYQHSNIQSQKCSDMDSYNLGYDIAKDQQGLVGVDCNYLYDIAKTQKDNINLTCFCIGVSDFRSNASRSTITNDESITQSTEKTNYSMDRVNKAKDNVDSIKKSENNTDSLMSSKKNEQFGRPKAYEEIIFTGTLSNNYTIKFIFASGYDLANSFVLTDNKSNISKQFIRVPEYEKIPGEQLFYQSDENNKTYFMLKLKSDPDVIPNQLYGTFYHDHISENFTLHNIKN